MLAPLSWLFSIIPRLRRLVLQFFYQGKPFSVPVAVVGNITVGGSGKTPLIIALVTPLMSVVIKLVLLVVVMAVMLMSIL